MNYLVRIGVGLPPAIAAPQRGGLLQAELDRGLELRRSGAIDAIWRIPGALPNVGIWAAADATERHELIAGLPVFPAIEADATPLAGHPINRQEES